MSDIKRENVDKVLWIAKDIHSRAFVFITRAYETWNDKMELQYNHSKTARLSFNIDSAQARYSEIVSRLFTEITEQRVYVTTQWENFCYIPWRSSLRFSNHIVFVSRV